MDTKITITAEHAEMAQRAERMIKRGDSRISFFRASTFWPPPAKPVPPPSQT